MPKWEIVYKDDKTEVVEGSIGATYDNSDNIIRFFDEKGRIIKIVSVSNFQSITRLEDEDE